MQSVRIMHCFKCKPLQAYARLEAPYAPRAGESGEGALGVFEGPLHQPRSPPPPRDTKLIIPSIRFLGIKTPGSAPTPCHIAGHYQDLGISS